MVWLTVINYGAVILGNRDFTCINAVQNRAMGFFMEVGKYTPNDAIAWDMGWKPPYVRQLACIFRRWAKCSNMDPNRINCNILNGLYENIMPN